MIQVLNFISKLPLVEPRHWHLALAETRTEVCRSGHRAGLASESLSSDAPRSKLICWAARLDQEKRKNEEAGVVFVFVLRISIANEGIPVNRPYCSIESCYTVSY